MKWRGRRGSDNVEDRRGDSGGFGGGLGGGFGGGAPRGGFRIPTGGRGGGGGRIGIGGLIVILIVLWFLGINPLTLLEGLDDSRPGTTIGSSTGTGESGFVPGGEGAPSTEEEMKQFVRVVLADTEDVWHSLFSAAGRTYEEPRLVLFSGRIASACGQASAAAGPFYCPNDEKIYLDMDFFQEMARRFNAAGDFADAYVIAHEVGHHVQNQLGILPQFNAMRGRLSPADANAMSVRIELQADCFAGIWANRAAAAGNLEAGDIDEALNAAHQIGDDTLQKRSQGYVVPDSFTHGTAAQRARWFKAGFDAGKLSACNTLDAKSL